LLVLITHHLNNNPFSPLAIELSVVNLLPGAEIQLALCYGYDYLMMDKQAF
jgi:hypothetical protein